MKSISVLVLVPIISFSAWWGYNQQAAATPVTAVVASSYSESEPGFDAAPPPIPVSEARIGKGVGYPISELATWQRPAGPLRVGIQSGHYENEEVPEELRGLTGNTGAQFGLLTEREVVRIIAELVQTELEAADVEVDLLPTTVPPGYLADAFISIHADGNRDTRARGYKIAPPRRDYSGRSNALVTNLYDAYALATGLPTDRAITNRMTAYYAFNWPRYEHSVHPQTPAAIVETGFLTNPIDRTVIVETPERVASGIVAGVLTFLRTELDRTSTPLPLIIPTLPITGELVCAPLRAERIARGQQSENCTIAIMHESGVPVLLVSEPESLLFEELIARRGQTISITGEYVPLQRLDNYFWFQFEVLGLLQNPSILQ